MGEGVICKLPVIGFAGPALSGKDTAANYFAELTGFTRVALADTLKDDVIEAGLATHEECYVTKPPHVRRLLQWYGTDVCRKLAGRSYWLDRWRERIETVVGADGKPPHGYLIPDIRFPNEAMWVAGAFRLGYLIQIDASERLGASGPLHSSESHFSEISDAMVARKAHCYDIVNNNGTLGELRSGELPRAFAKWANFLDVMQRDHVGSDIVGGSKWS